MRLYIYTILLSTFFLPCSLLSQLTIDTIELNTTFIPLKANETGRNITVISSENITETPFTSLDDLIQKFPGVEMQTRNRFGAQADITLRGSTFPQVLVLVDGMKLNDPLTGHFNSYIPVSPGEIERIEILRGAASALYGSEAVGGVINIITKKFGTTQATVTNLNGEIDLGQYNLRSTNNNISVQNKSYFFNAGINYAESDGQEIDSNRLEGVTLDSYSPFFDILTLGASGGVKLNDNFSLTGRTSYDNRDFSARYFYTTSRFDKSVENTTNLFNQLQLKHVGNTSSTQINLAHRRGTDEFVFSPDFPSTNVHTTHFFNAQIHHLRSINETLSLNLGIQADRRKIESTDRGNHSDIHSAAFAMLNYTPQQNISINLSGRLDNDENFGLAFTPQMNASLRQGKINYRASVGKSIRGADYTERYVSFNLENLTPGRSLGNPNLKAEEAWSEEIGFDFYPNKHWTFKSTLFARQSSNLIDYVSTNEADIENNTNLQAGQDYFYAQNITDVSTVGLELELWHSLIKSNTISLDGSLGYTYLSTSNDQDIISVYISNHANHLLSANAVLGYGKFDLSITSLWKDRSELFAESINQTIKSNFNNWDIQLSYSPIDQARFHLKIFNVFDQQNQDILGAVLPGRWISGGLRYNFTRAQ